MSLEVGKAIEGGKPVKELHLNAYAKINLTLDVLEARSDGYHDIETVMHTIALHDSVTLREAGAGVEVIVHDGEVPNDHRNLVMRTAQLLRETFKVDRNVQIELTKRIPVAAGLGGGSADAAIEVVKIGAASHGDVLAVVHVFAIGKGVGSGAAPKMGPGFQQGDAVTVLSQRGGGGQARQPAADDQYAVGGHWNGSTSRGAREE